MSLFTESFYSDSTRNFVNNPIPGLGDTITIKFQMLENQDIDSVFLMRIRNGAEEYHEMKKAENRGELASYVVDIDVNEPSLSYHFVVALKDVIYYYTQAGVTTYVPDNADNFVILAGFKQPDWVESAVFYQIFPSAWGGCNGIKEHIPYLKELGVNAIYLNPIFKAESYHKYDCADYFHVDEAFGGDEAFAELTRELHNNDIKIILDISINHTGLPNAWVTEHPEFYVRDKDGEIKGWAGYKSLPVLDYRNEELRDLIYRKPDSVLLKWLKAPYNIDGWRFDVADVFGRNDEVQLADELWREVCDAIRAEKPDAFIIGEHWGDCTKYNLGDLWNTPMNYYGYGRILRQFVGLPELFIARNEKLAKIPYKLTAADVVARTVEHYSKLPQVIADAQMNLVDSHDVPRVHNYEGYGLNEAKMILISQLLWTGIPCIYYGDEIGIDGYVEHDSGFRYEMPWNDITPENDYLKVYKKAISLRRGVDAFAKGSRKVIYADGYTFAVARFFGDDIYVGVISMEDEAREVLLPLNLVGATEASANTDLFGTAFEGTKAENGTFKLNMPSKSALLFKVN